MKNTKTFYSWLIKLLVIVLFLCPLTASMENSTPAPLPQDVKLTAMVQSEKGGLTLYKEASEQSDIISFYQNGSPLVITQETSDQWLKVAIGGDHTIEGYMLRKEVLLTFNQDFLFKTKDLIPNLSKNPTWNLYASASEEAATINYNGSVPYYAMAIGINGNYWHVLVDLGNGEFKTGFVPMSMESTSFEVAVVNNAENTDRLHLRTKPSATAPSKGKYYNGTKVYILEEAKEGWVKVYLPVTDNSKGFIGYMDSKFLATGPARDSVEEAFPTITVHNKNKQLNLRLRDQPSDKGATLEVYDNGSMVKVLGLSKDWYHVQTEDGKIGFMLGKFLEPKIPFDYKK